jgi:hypothetical protein
MSMFRFWKKTKSSNSSQQSEGELSISIGDTVRVVSSSDAPKELSGRVGQVYGQTSPSATGIKVIGKMVSDTAYNVQFPEIKGIFWLAPKLLEFVDHAPDTQISIGKKSFIRNASGEWEEGKS